MSYERPEIKIISSITKLYVVKDIIVLYLDRLSCKQYIEYLCHLHKDLCKKDMIDYVKRIEDVNKIYKEVNKVWKMERLNGIDARFTLFRLTKREKKILWEIINENLNMNIVEFPPKILS